MRLFLSIIGFIVFLQCQGQSRIEGYVHDLVTGKPLKGTRINLLLLHSIHFTPGPLDSLDFIIYRRDTRYDTIYKRIDTIFSDSNGYYKFNDLSPGIYQLCAVHRIKEISPKKWEVEYEYSNGIKIENGQIITHSFILHVTCEYDSTKDQDHCPKYKLTDKVLPIKYGMVTNFDNLDPKYYYNGYCVIERCHPTKHCMRCDLDF